MGRQYKRSTDFHGSPILTIRRLAEDGDLLPEYLSTQAMEALKEAFKIAGRVLPEPRQLARWQRRLKYFLHHHNTVWDLIEAPEKKYVPPSIIPIHVTLDVLQPEWMKYNIHVEDFERAGTVLVGTEDQRQYLLPVVFTAATPGPKPRIIRMRLLNRPEWPRMAAQRRMHVCPW